MSYLGEENSWREDGCYTCGRRIVLGNLCSRCDLGEDPGKRPVSPKVEQWFRESREYHAGIKAKYAALAEELRGKPAQASTAHWRDK